MITISTTKKRFGRPPSRESEDAIKATALEARMRQTLGVEEWQDRKRGGQAALAAAMKKLDNPLLGYALGRMLYTKGIDQKQHDAGSYFVWIWKTNARLTGAPSPNVKAIDYGATTGGYSTYAEDSPEWVDDIKKRFREAQRAIYEADDDKFGHRAGARMEVLKRILVEDKAPANATELGTLRISLNAINQSRGVK